MIESIRLNDYKAFKEVQIPIKPLTIFLGANSVGKSSIIQMLMLLHQTAEGRNEMYTSAFKIYGKYVNVGSYENLIRDKDKSRVLQVSIDFKSPEIEYRLKKCKLDFISRFRKAAGAFPQTDIQEIYKNDINTREDFENYITKFITTVKENASTDNHLLQFLQYRLDLHLNLDDRNSIQDIMRCYDLRDALSKSAGIDYSISFHLQADGGFLKIKRFICSSNDGYVILDIERKTEKNIKVNSDFGLNGKDAEYLSRIVNLNNTIFDIFDYDPDYDIDVESTLVSTFIYNLVSRILSVFRDDFRDENVNYVSPLRAHPKRYYMLDKAKMSISLDTLDGDAIAEVLKENKSVKKKVNQWFSKFDFNIDVNMLKEVIHHMSVKQNGLDLDITDVGFGISQVLPIIIQGFLSQEDSLTIIEQPEIHLHPQMQADLGDLFIDIVQNDNKKIIVETHSEYLLRRIRRRISEGRINSEDVAICLFHQRENNSPAWVEVLEVGEKGEFKWPKEFYGGELYNDTIEFLKNQS